MELPMWIWLNTERLAPMRWTPKTLKTEPHRMNERALMQEAKEVSHWMEAIEPNFTNDLNDKLLAKFTASNTE
jgi:hypothetical protein